MKIAIISRHPAPYRDPMLARLANCKEFDVDIFNELPLDAGHAYWNLKEHGYVARPLFDEHASWLGQFVRLIREFVFGEYALSIWPGFMNVKIVLTMLALAVMHRRYGVMADTIVASARLGFKERIRRFIIRRAALIWVPGKAGSEYFGKRYGVEEELILWGVYTLDGEKLAGEIKDIRSKKAELRGRFGLENSDDVFLMVANMIPSRNYPILVQAFSMFAQRRAHSKLMICGVGPDLDGMMNYAKTHPELIVIPGSSFDETKKLYALADVYVHSGTEPASTALVIGAIAGLPILTSSAVGCAADVLEDGKSGVVVADYLSVDAWCEGFRKMMEKKTHWMTMGVYARELSRKLDVDEIYPRFVEKVLQA